MTTTAPPPALMRLLASWLATSREEVRQYLIDNGDAATAAHIAAGCPSLCGSAEAAAWIMENGAREAPCTERQPATEK